MDVAPLTDFFDINNETSTQNMMEVLSSFECKRDLDVQNFLRKNAIKYEKAGISRTYLCYDENGIIGYFSLAIKTLKFLKSVSKSKRQKLSGGEAGDRNANSIPAYLLGQLGKDDRFKTKNFGIYVMNRIFEIINLSKELVGGVFIYLDCKKCQSPALRDYYERFGFSYLQEDDDYLQMIQYI